MQLAQACRATLRGPEDVFSTLRRSFSACVWLTRCAVSNEPVDHAEVYLLNNFGVPSPSMQLAQACRATLRGPEDVFSTLRRSFSACVWLTRCAVSNEPVDHAEVYLLNNFGVPSPSMQLAQACRATLRGPEDVFSTLRRSFSACVWLTRCAVSNEPVDHAEVYLLNNFGVPSPSMQLAQACRATLRGPEDVFSTLRRSFSACVWLTRCAVSNEPVDHAEVYLLNNFGVPSPSMQLAQACRATLRGPEDVFSTLRRSFSACVWLTRCAVSNEPLTTRR